MNNESQQSRTQSKRINLLQEYHNEKRSDDQRIQLRKILIWLFIFCCAYFIYIGHNDNQQGHSTTVQHSQQSIVTNQQIENERSHETTQKTGSQTHQISQSEQNIKHKNNQQNIQEHENVIQNDVPSKKHHVDVQFIEQHKIQGQKQYFNHNISDLNTQNGQSNIPEEEI